MRTTETRETAGIRAKRGGAAEKGSNLKNSSRCRSMDAPERWGPGGRVGLAGVSAQSPLPRHPSRFTRLQVVAPMASRRAAAQLLMCASTWTWPRARRLGPSARQFLPACLGERWTACPRPKSVKSQPCPRRRPEVRRLRARNAAGERQASIKDDTGRSTDRLLPDVICSAAWHARLRHTLTAA